MEGKERETRSYSSLSSRHNLPTANKQASKAKHTDTCKQSKTAVVLSSVRFVFIPVTKNMCDTAGQSGLGWAVMHQVGALVL